MIGPAEPPRPRPVFARHAASLLVLRPGPAGHEVLTGIRNAAHRFMPNCLVFPGGAVDPGDARAPAAAEPNPGLLADLGRSAKPGLARAIAMAAARELHEEAGLSLGAPPRLDALDYLCRAVTPPGSPIRFNARFLVVHASATHGTPADSRELRAVAYRSLDAILRDELMLVTREVLLRLVEWLDQPSSNQTGRRTLQVFKGKRWRPD